MNSHCKPLPPPALPPHLLPSHTDFPVVLIQWGQAGIQSWKLRWGKESFVGGKKRGSFCLYSPQINSLVQFTKWFHKQLQQSKTGNDQEEEQI